MIISLKLHIKIWLFLFFCLCLLIMPNYSLATNTLNQGDVFNSSSRLNSTNGLFTLGFSGRYLVINSTIEEDLKLIHPVWSANRYNPISKNSTSFLTIDEFGSLKINQLNVDPIVIYASKSNSTTINTTAVLRDDGNFVLKQNENIVLWQSFDHPTDTLLPGMKLGVDKRTGNKWIVSSWLNEIIPTKGAFTMEWEPEERQVIIKRRGIRFWSSGVLSSHNKFENLRADINNRNYIISSVSNEEEDYITYSMYVEPNLLLNPSPEALILLNISRWFLDFTGNLIDGIGTHGYYLIACSDCCDGSYTKEGCEKWGRPLKCRRDGDRFLYSAGNFQAQYIEYEDNKNLSFIDCKDKCWNWKDCKCTAFDYEEESGCLFYTGSYGGESLANGRVPFGSGGRSQMHMIVQGPPPRKNWIWIVTVVVVVPTVMVAVMFWYLRWKKLKQEEKFLKELLTWDKPGDKTNELEDDSDRNQTLKVYSFASIKTATNSFSSKNKLGQGGFGSVYKGRLREGIEIAVKRLSKKSGQGLVEFKNELLFIAKLQHVNLVRLLGFCIQEEERLLVYEYLPNKSLDFYIFGDESRRELLDWNKRFNIIEGIAQGLLYLHKYSRLRIIHRDLKAGNVLLDKEMNPKISDFGMARIFGGNENEANTNRIVGTHGYMSPEYAMHGIFSVKSDVYSFGVLLLEIVSGKKNHNVYDYESMINLVGKAWNLWQGDDALGLLDTTLLDSVVKEQALRCINVGLLCVEERASDRPNMWNVLSMLASDVQLPVPKHPAFYVGESIATSSTAFPEENQSANGMSFTEMDGR